MPQVLQTRAVQWYHCYLQHPGISRLEETQVAVMWWPGLRVAVRQHAKSCKRCQFGKQRKQKYGHIPPKIANQVPWQKVCVELICPYMLKGQDSKTTDFMCLAIIDPATG
eukprot:1300969-Ditylum_brightwellii.AAC.1